jgi:hypothetical protein
MDELEQSNDDFLFTEAVKTSYAQTPSVNPTLTLFAANEAFPAQDIANEMAMRGPAYVANERAKLERDENIQILKGATMSLAKEGNAPAVQTALNELNNLQVGQAAEPSFYDDSATVVESKLEQVMIATGKTREQIISDVNLYKNNLATRIAIETAIEGLAQRSTVGQLAQDITGVTTVSDWSRVSPIINEELEKLGFTGSRAVTFATSVENMVGMLNNIDAGDRGKVVDSWRNRLVGAVGEKTTRRIFETIQANLTQDSTTEGIFGLLDLTGLTAIVKGTMRAGLEGTKALSVSKRIGSEKGVASDAVNKLTDDISILGMSKEEAAEAALNVKTLTPDASTGISSEIQKVLRERTEATLKEVNLAINTGGADPSELMATKARLERIYSNKHNSSIVSSEVNADLATGKINIDVLYGDSTGKAFDTAEEALAYYKDWKKGNLEVVPVSGSRVELDAKIADVDATIASTLTEIDEARFAPYMSKTATLTQVSRLPLFSYPRNARMNEAYVESAEAAIAAAPKVGDVWQTLRATAKPQEQFVVDKLLKTLPEETKVVIKAGEGRSHYIGNTNTMTLYRGGSDTNVFTHELIHAVTSSRIRYGELNPSSTLGKSVTKLDDLRNVVRKEIGKIKDDSLKKDLDYLTSDIHEFSTAGLWSIYQLPKVAAYLDSIPYKNTTLLSKVWEAFKEVLGFGSKDTALSEWFGLGEEISREGLKVKLTQQLTVGDKLYTIPSVDRTFPANKTVYINESVDGKLTKLEKSVAEKLSLVDRRDSPVSGFYVRQKADMPVFTEDIGKITEDELSRMHLMLGKLNPRLATPNSIYGPSVTSMYKATKFEKLYSDFTKQSFDKLNSASVDKVNNALIRTEELKRDMTTLELQALGVATPAEQEAYYAFRTMRNIQHYTKNKAAAEYLTAQGFNDVFVGMDDLGSLSGPAKPLKLEDVANKNVFDVENNKMVAVTPDKAKELDARGLVIYRYLKAQTLEGRRGHITTIAVPAHKLRVGDITSVVGKVDGAYARIYNDEYWIKLTNTQLIDDVEEKVTYAFRTATSEKDAAAYVAGLNSLLDMRKATRIIDEKAVSKALGAFEQDAQKLADDINAGVYDGAVARFNYNRIDDNYFREITGIGGRETVSDGKVFWSGRSESAIKSITNGSTGADIKGPLASLEAEISNTARFTATNEFRRNAIQRWYNTFNEVISDQDKLGTKSAEEVFFNVVNRVSGYALHEPQAKRMLAVKDYILTQLGAKTQDERMLQHAVNNLTGNITVPGFSHVGQWLRKTDLINWAKSTNSTLMLGLFSPAQLIVQSSGMLLATTISPKHGLKAAFSIRPILSALTSDNPSVWRWVHKAADVAKTTGMKSDEFARVAAAIKRTGIIDNIGASSLYNGADGATNIFSKNKAKFNQAQMMFFNKGEEISRVAAFDIARREFIEANPGVLWDTDDALSTIVLRADDLTMNMSRVNDARYTQGVFGVPLQFLQHNIRLGTNIAAQLGSIVGKKSLTLTPQEAMRLTLGSYLLYGINNNATPDFIEDWLGNELNGQLSDQQKQYLTQGVLAGLLSTIGETLTGERTNIALGSRLSSIQWYEDLGDAIFDVFKGEKVDISRLAGPTGSTLTSVMELPIIFRDYMQKDEWDLGDFGRTVSAAFGTLSSTWRNVDKAYWAYHADGFVLNKRGDPLAQLSWTELIAQALGFQSTEAYESGTVFSTNKDYASTMQKYAEAIMRYEGLARKAYLTNDIESMNTNYRAASAVIAPLPEADQQFIKRLIRERTSYDTVGREAFNKWASEFSTHKNRLLVTNPYGEE